ncbi:hypothetical protein M5M_01535 [Simiduia agarivorans SA1 = DSM 21679]|uniref:DUF748 domain-containing protein n=1 Tax=Simiduia agarivorans (strain DSM 21679 / JCM 13881 / BCRC 17597 / SA1) TaxID=1117647 RepID=K4KEP5_SIMAS|nr:hypothetical protein M5M_01535 [Simiduia agarivorans SA1 = DSM 21679]
MSSRLQTIAKWLVKLTTVYFFGSLALVWPLLNAFLAPAYQSQTNRALHYDLAGFNPLTLSVFVYGAEDRNPDGSVLWRLDSATVNLSLLQTLTTAAITFDAIALTGLQLKPEKTGETRFNFSDIIDFRAAQSSATATPADDAAAGLPRVRINTLSLQAKLLQYTDATRAKPYVNGLRDIAFVLEDFSTLSDDGDGYALRAEGVAGGVIEWRGHISAAGTRTWGEFSIHNMSLMPLWEFAEPQLAFELHRGQFNLNGHYTVNWKDQLHWQLSEGALDVNQLALSARDTGNDSQLGFDRFSVRLQSLGNRLQSAVLEQVTLEKLSLQSWHENQTVGLIQMFALPATQATAAETADPATQPWQWRINQLAVTDAEVQWRVPELDQRVLKLAPINLRVSALNSGEEPADIQLGFLVDNTARLAATGQWQTPRQQLDLKLQMDRLPLAWANPVIDDHLALKVTDGELETQVNLQIEGGELKQIQSEALINQLRTSDARGRALTGFSQLAVNGAKVSLAERELTIEQIAIDSLSGRLTINQDGTTNLNALVRNDTPPETQQTPPDAPAPTWRWQINSVALKDAAIGFTDETPLSPFSAQIQNFTGELTPVSSNADQPIAVNFKGNVDGYAPVTLKGWAKPLLADPAIDLSLKFAAMDLGVFNPYSTTFTGWQIEKGLLTVEMDYGLDQKRIVGNNRVVLDQLELGERINSKRLVDIPLRLALALLTDENGVADLAVPVSGTTDDPDFSVGSIIWAALRNSIMKLVTAPFNLLASLVDSEEDLGFIEFAELSSSITPDAANKLDALKNALDQRPSLRIGIVGDVSAAEMRQLRTQALQAMLTEKGVSPADTDALNNRWASGAATLLSERNLAVPDTPAALQKALLQSQPMPVAALNELSQTRALATKQHFLNQLGLAPDRVFVHSVSIDCSEKARCEGPMAKFEISN